LHWRYLKQTKKETIHFLKSAEIVNGKKCFMRKATAPTGGEKWRILASEEDYDSYVKSETHQK
jgi:hypothetical protein